MKKKPNSLPYICPRHTDTRLQSVLSGGAGYCPRCMYFVQSANHPMPTMPPRIEAKPKPKRKRKASTKKGVMVRT